MWADALNARLYRFCAQEERDLPRRFSRECSRRAEVVVAGDHDEIGALVEHLEPGFGALRPIGLRIRGHDFDMPAQQTARLIDFVDADHRRVLRGLVIGLHESGLRGREADDDIVLRKRAASAADNSGKRKRRA